MMNHFRKILNRLMGALLGPFALPFMFLTKNTSSIFIIESEKLPEILKGKSFQEATEIFNQNRDEKNPVILIGVRRMCKDSKTVGFRLWEVHISFPRI